MRTLSMRGAKSDLIPPPIFQRSSTGLLKMPSSKRLLVSPASFPSQEVKESTHSTDQIEQSENEYWEEVEEEVASCDYYEEEIICEDNGDFVEEIVEEFDTVGKSKITFRSYDDIQTTIHIENYTKGEICKVWYSCNDYDKMVQKARALVAKEEVHSFSANLKMKNDKSSNADRSMQVDEKMKTLHDLRGLEGWSSKGSEIVKALRERALDIVWEEQSRQMQSGEYNDEMIRDEYLKVSHGAQIAAEVRAAEDRIQADEIYGPNKARGRRGMLRKSKSMFGRATSTRLLKAKRKVQKVMSKRNITDDERPKIYRQPSQGSRLFSTANIDGSESMSLDRGNRGTLDKSFSTDLSESGSKRQMRPHLLARIPSWETGLSSGKF